MLIYFLYKNGIQSVPRLRIKKSSLLKYQKGSLLRVLERFFTQGSKKFLDQKSTKKFLNQETFTHL